MADPSIGKAKLQVGIDKAQVAKEADAAVTPAFENAAKNAAKAIAGIAVGRQLIEGAKAGFDELAEGQKIAAQSSVLLRNEANITAGDIENLGQSMLDLAGFDDEAAKSAANVLLRFGAIHDAGTLKRVETDAADLAIAMGTDLPSAAQLLGQALQAPDRAARLLRSSIGALSDNQIAAIKHFQEIGDSASAQGVILDALESRIGGTAAAYGDTLPGSVDRAKQSFANARASLVEGLTPAIEFAAEATTTLSGVIEDLPGPLRTVASLAVGAGVGIAGIAAPIANVISGIESFRSARAAAAAVSATSATADAAATAALTAESAAMTEFAAANAAAIPAVLANATATGTLGAASAVTAAEVETLAAAEGAGAAASAGFMAALGPLGVAAGVAAIAIAGISQKGEKVSVDLRKFASSTDRELIDVYDNIKKTFGGELVGDFIKQLANGGQEGVGALVRLRDNLKAAGQDTSALDRALAGAKTQFQNTGTSTSAAAGYLGDFKTAEEQAKDASDSLNASLETRKGKLDEIQAKQDTARGGQQSVVGLILGEHQADLARRDALDKIAEAQEKVNKATTPEEKAKATTELEKATVDYESAINRQAEAQRDVEVAQREATGATVTASDKTALYISSLQHLTDDAIGPAKEELQALRDKISGLAESYYTKLQYTLEVNGYTLSAYEVQALLDLGLGLSVEALNKEAQKQSGTYQTGGAYASGGYAPAGMAFRHGEQGDFEVAILGDGVSRLQQDAFVLDHQHSVDFLGGNQQSAPLLNIGSLQTLDVNDTIHKLEVAAMKANNLQLARR